MALALNNLKRVDMPLNKETKSSLVNIGPIEYLEDRGIYSNYLQRKKKFCEDAILKLPERFRYKIRLSIYC